MKIHFKSIAFTLIVLCLPGVPALHAEADDKTSREQVLAPGYGTLQYTAPEPGTYRLPPFGEAADGVVINSDAQETTLYELMGEKIVLLSFIYSTCSDVNGCPLATAVFHKIKRRLKKEPELAQKIRLLTLSFNPEYDTPDRMKKYSHGLRGEGVEWEFLTTASEKELQPILDHYQQNIQKEYDAQGNFLGTFSHILRVYLIDRNKQLRNIYSVSFLHPDTLINDMKTLLMAPSPAPQPSGNAQSSHSDSLSPLYTAGDNKSGYEQDEYHTRSIALTDRAGQPVDLMQYVKNPPLGLPAVPIPENNPITSAKIDLGKKLFYDRRLSLNNTFSCAMCHIPEQGFTSQEMKTAVGFEGRTVRRNSPTIYNTAYYTALFNDSRETTLEQQVWGPLLATNEMANPSIGFVIEKIKSLSDYNHLFEKAFGRGPGMETVGMAIASYERTLNSANSSFDRWFYGKEKNAISDQAKKGYQLFNGKAGCVGCHTITSEHALFTDNQLHNTGIGYADSMDIKPTKQRIQVAPGTYIDIDSDLIDSISEPKPADLGRYEVTQLPEDRWKYKTPSLRNISLTAPYMHNGVFETLKQVVEFYNRGGIPNENLDPLIQPLNLNGQEIDELIAFLLALTGDNVSQLVSDAYTVPVGDPD